MQPFVKWAGGKRQYIKTILEMAPKKFDRYYEPFVGGGAVLFALNHSSSVINDINTHLIHTYKIIKNQPLELMNIINKYDRIILDNEKYKEIRSLYNSHIENKIYNIETAALFIFLNKHAFNGLFRVNSKGLFNVPWNKKERLKSYNEDNIFEISNYLQSIDIRCEDFESSLFDIEQNDFVFFDSPYAPLNNNSFTAYDKTGFKVGEHVRLSEVFKSLTDSGIKCMLTNHNTELIQELYKDFKKVEINVKRNINSDATKRIGKELIITNY